MKFKSLSECAVVVYFEDEVSEANLLHISAFNKAIYEQPFAGFLETVPAYTTLTVYFNPKLVRQNDLLKGVRAYQSVIHYLEKLSLTLLINQSIVKHELIHVPVCYDEVFGPDLAYVAQYNKLNIADVIQLHCSAIYTVYMVGFMPGFPYLGGMSSQIATPRRDLPRSSIKAGSVGIGGEQTGIYPLNSPGGWQLIGRTPMQLFNSANMPPALFKAGQSVKFQAINRDEFDVIARSQAYAY